MPFLQSSGAISINDLKNFFPGLGTGNSLSNFYRGGGRVPTTKNVSTRTPATGDFYNDANFWQNSGGTTYMVWNWAVIVNGAIGDPSSYTVGNRTYYKGDARIVSKNFYQWGIFIIDDSTVSINTGIPASGTIRLNQFYGAERP